MIGRLVALVAGIASVTLPAAGQNDGITRPCSSTELVGPDVRESCRMAAEAAAAAHPQLGILLAGGNPVPGGAQGAGGFRLGLVPGVSASLRAGFAHGNLPDLGGTQTAGTRTVNSLAVTGVLTVGVFRGLDAAPMLGGIGSLELLGDATWLPGEIADADALRSDGSRIGLGIGARVGVLRESFVTPAMSLSLVHRRLGSGTAGGVCGTEAALITAEQVNDVRVQRGACTSPASDRGEFTFDLRDTSLRAMVSKRFLGLGLGGGGGYDWFSGEGGYGFRSAGDPTFYRVSGVAFDAGRASAFLNGLLTLPLVTFAAEAGWMQGGGESAEEGTWFGSVGARLSL